MTQTSVVGDSDQEGRPLMRQSRELSRVAGYALSLLSTLVAPGLTKVSGSPMDSSRGSSSYKIEDKDVLHLFKAAIDTRQNLIKDLNEIDSALKNNPSADRAGELERRQYQTRSEIYQLDERIAQITTYTLALGFVSIYKEAKGDPNRTHDPATLRSIAEFRKVSSDLARSLNLFDPQMGAFIAHSAHLIESLAILGSAEKITAGMATGVVGAIFGLFSMFFGGGDPEAEFQYKREVLKRLENIKESVDELKAYTAYRFDRLEVLGYRTLETIMWTNKFISALDYRSAQQSQLLGELEKEVQEFRKVTSADSQLHSNQLSSIHWKEFNNALTDSYPKNFADKYGGLDPTTRKKEANRIFLALWDGVTKTDVPDTKLQLLSTATGLTAEQLWSLFAAYKSRGFYQLVANVIAAKQAQSIDAGASPVNAVPILPVDPSRFILGANAIISFCESVPDAPKLTYDQINRLSEEASKILGFQAWLVKKENRQALETNLNIAVDLFVSTLKRLINSPDYNTRDSSQTFKEKHETLNLNQNLSQFELPLDPKICRKNFTFRLGDGKSAGHLSEEFETKLKSYQTKKRIGDGRIEMQFPGYIYDISPFTRGALALSGSGDYTLRYGWSPISWKRDPYPPFAHYYEGPAHWNRGSAHNRMRYHNNASWYKEQTFVTVGVMLAIEFDVPNLHPSSTTSLLQVLPLVRLSVNSDRRFVASTRYTSFRYTGTAEKSASETGVTLPKDPDALQKLEQAARDQNGLIDGPSETFPEEAFNYSHALTKSAAIIFPYLLQEIRKQVGLELANSVVNIRLFTSKDRQPRLSFDIDITPERFCKLAPPPISEKATTSGKSINIDIGSLSPEMVSVVSKALQDNGVHEDGVRISAVIRRDRNALAGVLAAQQAKLGELIVKNLIQPGALKRALDLYCDTFDVYRATLGEGAPGVIVQDQELLENIFGNMRIRSSAQFAHTFLRRLEALDPKDPEAFPAMIKELEDEIKGSLKSLYELVDSALGRGGEADLGYEEIWSLLWRLQRYRASLDGGNKSMAVPQANGIEQME